eukprot:TRINITY_DN817_c0_g1_i17.p1 TRINITY_DN817_c0_g1~~TRINITY_DN817_c0_g1_i17.p1  ORF type:complete len:195 (+),score=51.69 TRINITY_DN817_c0_g1_i17:324-908(+)
MAMQLAKCYNFKKLCLLDISPDLISELKRKQKGDEKKVEFVLGDCRDMTQIFPNPGTFGLIIDKGTLDALHTIHERQKMMNECIRILNSKGIFISVAFSDPGRLNFLKSEAQRLELENHTYLIAKGDPKHGHGAKFLTILFKKGNTTFDSTSCSVPYNPDPLTKQILDRIKLTGSLYEEEVVEDTPDIWDLEMS